MNLSNLNAYEILEQRPVSDLNSEGAILRHKKTGARVLLLSNDDNNKVFYIGFRTPPTDFTGVAHINEHSVLCGSEKYPVKDPFVELAKGSLNTFLNAMTYPDKTVYPVASCNDKDFANLCDVYLDAVFHPNIYKEKKIFEQEGWHYEVDENGRLTINGVVYNEMKGAYSSADDVLEREIMNALFPDNAYGVDSGGRPENIPDLTYEDFLDFHRRFYHPSNSYIYLYGNMDMVERLEYIDREYLSSYDRLEIDSEVKYQKPFDGKKVLKAEYPVLESEQRENMHYFSYTVAAKKSLDPEFYIALDVLDYALCSAPGAPVKVALQAAGIGEDDYSVAETGILQPYFSFISKNAREGEGERFVQIIEDTLEDLVTNGINRDSLNAAINLFAFKYKEADYGSYPKGLMYGLQALDSWLYDDMAPFMYIEANETYNRLRAKVEQGYFEELIRDLILNNPHKVLLELVPSKTKARENDAKLEKRLADYQKTLTEEELGEIRSHANELKEYQASADRPEDLAKIPMLTRADLKREAQPFKNSKHMLTIGETNIPLWQHDYFTNKVSYLRVIFDITDLPDDMLFDLGLLKTVMGLVDTKHYTYGELFNEINLRTGGITTPVGISPDYAKEDGVRAFFEFKGRCFEENTAEAVALMKEMLFYSDFSDTDRIRDILIETKAGMQASLQAAGHTTAVSRAMSKMTRFGRISDRIAGISFMDELTRLIADYDRLGGGLAARFERVLAYLKDRDRVILDFTGQDQGRELFEKEVESFLAELPAAGGPDSKRMIGDSLREEEEYRQKKEGFLTSSDVCYVCRAGDFKKAGLEYTGALKVLGVLMGYDYLWLNVRVQGGAYGCSSSFLRTGQSYFVSYRDPNLEKTIQVYEAASDYIRDMVLDEDSMTRYIIGAIAAMDMPLTPQAAGIRSWSALVTGKTYEQEQRERLEVIDCTIDEIHRLADYIKAVMDDSILIVDGKEDQIKAAGELFDQVRPLFEG